jgi:ribonuclease P protein component
MIPRPKRLSISSSSKKGTPIIRSPYFSVYRFSNKLDYNRLAVIVSKRSAPLAVTRHRLKRQLLQTMNSWPEKGYDITLVPQKKYVELKQKERAKILSELTKNILS